MNQEWMRLDNAAKIYPLIESDYITTVYRFSATLDEMIDKDLLYIALNKVIRRFPYFKVTLKRGFFWFYLEENKKDLVLFEDTMMVCRRMFDDENNGYLFRVLYIDHKISVEFNHILGDGTACLTFLNTLVYEYLKCLGHTITRNEWMKDVDEDASDEEFEDSHSLIGRKYLKSHNKKVPVIKGVFHLKDRLIKRTQYIVTYSIMDSQILYDTAKKYQCSITIFLTAIYLECMLDIQREQIKNKRNRKPVSIQVPINMRKRLDSKSMRNFSLYIIPFLQSDQSYTFEDIIKQVQLFFNEQTDLNVLLSLMVQNVKTERSPFVRLLPLRLKTLVTPIIYKAQGVDTYSGTISNIGMIHLPEDVEKHITRFDFTLGPCPLSKNACAVTGFKGKVYLSFGRNTKEAWVEKRFFRKLVQLGVPVTIEGGEIK